MTSLHATSHGTRLVLGTLAALALLAATSAAAASTPVTSEQFAPGWQAHAHSLLWLGPTRSADRDKWRVPGILPRGEYVLIKRTGNTAELIGNRFTVSTAIVDQYLFVSSGEGEVQALPVEDVPSLRPKSAPPLQQ